MIEIENIIKYCSYLLNNCQEAEECRNYLDSRLSKEYQNIFEFGFFPSSSTMNLLKFFIDEDILKKNSLIYTKDLQDSHSARSCEFTFFENHPLIMPYKDVYGNIIGLVGRTIFSEKERSAIGCSKYKNTSFSKSNNVFGLNIAKQSILDFDCVFVVEGQFDVIKAFEKGLNNIVAVGTSNLSDYQLSIICRYTKNIFLLFDSDDAGEEGRKRVFRKYKEFANIKNVYLPMGYKDIDEYLQCNNIEYLLHSMKNN